MILYDIFNVLFIINTNEYTCKTDTKRFRSFTGGSLIKNLPANAGDVGSIPWGRKWQPTPVFLPGESHGRGSLAGYSPWGCGESDMT